MVFWTQLKKLFVSINFIQAFYFSLKLKFKMEEVQNIDPKIAATKNAIPHERLKLNCNIFVETLQNLFNECLTTGSFSDNVKLESF